ncbi:MAG TPA: serine hydrolase domain-containing protein [Solirubrobacteraceae bacterium]|nr:serine hydrolase domain-containing protein [Solirubrobacteraceae bacterium]
MAEVKGRYEERFAPVAEAFAQNLNSGADIGASVAVVHEGQFVVDIWGGDADPEQGAAWEEDTIVNVWSSTKTMAALCALILADRGELDLDAPVSTYWPAFSQAGKEAVEVRHLLSHTAGLAGWQERLDPRDLADWERCTGMLAAQAPWWEPGTASGYHALTQGYLIGEVVRRITGVSLGRFFAETVAKPLGADFHIGLAADDDQRVSPLHAPEPGNLREAGIPELGIRTFSNPVVGAPTAMEEWWRRAEIPAANGHGNARSVAAIQSVVSNGGEARGIRLLSEATISRIFEEQSNGPDLVLGVPLRFGMGYGLASETMPMGPHSFSWGGYGGSLVFNDLDARITVTYVMNRMEPGLLGDRRGASMVVGSIAALAAA